jgi:hypothetical protein
MTCQSFREAYSARLDSEETGLEATALDAHLASCPACRQWVPAADRLTRQTRIVAAPEVPDLTAEILARAPQSLFCETAGGRRPPDVSSPATGTKDGTTGPCAAQPIVVPIR